MQELNYSDIGERFVNESSPMTNDHLYHHGIKGQKWGVRRFQNKDGTRTPAGLKRYGDKIKEYGEKLKRKAAIRSVNKEAEKIRKKHISKLTDEELQQRIARAKKENELLNLERPISSLNKEHENLGKKFIVNAGQKVIGPALVDAGRTALTGYLTKMFKDKLGVDIDTDALKGLREEVDKLGLLNKKKDLTESLNGTKKSDDDDLAKQAKEWEYRKKIADGKKSEMELENRTRGDNNQQSGNSKPSDNSSNKGSSNGDSKPNVTVSESLSKKMADEAAKYVPSNSNASSVRELYKRTFPDEYFMTPLSDLEDYRKRVR